MSPRLVIAVAVLLAGSTAPVWAADLLAVPTSAGDAIPVASAFDWNGFYAGVYGVTRSSPNDGVQYGLGLELGYNARIQMVLVGGEVAIEGLTGGSGDASYLQSVGKVGLAVTDDVVLYGAAGAGVALGGVGESDILVGGGITMAVSDSVSLDARYLHAIPVEGANPKDQLTLGANFHF
ncbi:MAG: hypothetical protein ABI697_07565 [Devosia sp.]